MLKKRLKVLIVLIFLLLLPFINVFAVDDSFSSNAKDGDEYYLNNGSKLVDYDLNGNLYAMADTVTINSTINGDAFIVAKEVNIQSSGSITNNLFVIAERLNIDGSVNDLYACNSTDISITGHVNRDARILSNSNVDVLGTVGRNLLVFGTSDISFVDKDNQTSNQGIINGNLTYYATEEASISDNNIRGSIDYNAISVNEENEPKAIFLNHLLNFANGLVLIIILWLLSLWLAPNFIKNVDKVFTKKFGMTFLFGLLMFIVMPFVFILMLFTPITIVASLLLISLYIILLIISSSLFTITLNNFLCNKFKVKSNGGKLLYLIILSAILYIIKLIPIVGSIIALIIVLLGLGIILSYLTYNKKLTNEKSNS